MFGGGCGGGFGVGGEGWMVGIMGDLRDGGGWMDGVESRVCVRFEGLGWK